MKRAVYFTADWHLGHNNIIKFDNRPFHDIQEMEKSIIKRFNAVVPKYGITYILGDVGKIDNLSNVLNSLNGTKILVRGNHDKKMQGMMNAGFDVVIDTASIQISKQIVTMSHCPLLGVFREDVSGFKKSLPTDNWFKEHQYKEYSLPDFGQFHLHGHTHLYKGKGLVRDGRQWDVGVVGNNYMPVSFGQIESWIKSIVGK